MESANEPELDLRSIAECGDRWVVTFNATKTKLLSFNRHGDPFGASVLNDAPYMPIFLTRKNF